MASPLTQDVSVKNGPVPLPPLTDAGDLVLFDTTNPYVAQPEFFGCLVVLASWFPSETPVAMFVTYNVFTTAEESRVREVNTVYRAEAFRGLVDTVDAKPVTLAVAVGRWMFDQRHLEYHSADRTDQGDQWAGQVGGVIPDRVQEGTDEATARNGERALERLNEQLWPPWRT